MIIVEDSGKKKVPGKTLETPAWVWGVAHSHYLNDTEFIANYQYDINHANVCRISRC